MDRPVAPARAISMQALQRLPYYLQYLKTLRGEGRAVVAAPAVAEALHLNEVQVRKDFAAVSATRGKPKAGFCVEELIDSMEQFLGYRNVNDAVLVGAGALGSALLSYRGFDSCGMHILAAFDTDGRVVGSELGGRPVLPLDRLCGLCSRMNVHIGIIAVPEEEAQGACDLLVRAGILAVWNFAHVHLTAPDGILIRNENMAASLAMLSKHLQDKLSGKQALPEVKRA